MYKVYNLRSSKKGAKGNNNRNSDNSKTSKTSSVKQADFTTQSNMAKKLSATLDSVLQYLPNYEGKTQDNIEFFVQQYDKLVATSDLEDAVKLILLKSKISGKARELFLNLPDLLDCADYEQFKLLLIQTFKQSTIVAKSQTDFMSLKQAPTQTIEEYVKIFNIKAAKYLKDSGHADLQGAQKLLDTMKLHQFISTIRTDIAFELRKADVKTFEDAVNLAKSIEIAFNASENSVNSLNQSADQTIAEQNNRFSDTLTNIADVYGKQIENIQEQINAIKIAEVRQPAQANKKPHKSCDICKTVKSHSTEECYYNAKTHPNGTRKQNNIPMVPGYRTPVFQEQNLRDFQNFGGQNMAPQIQNNAPSWNSNNMSYDNPQFMVPRCNEYSINQNNYRYPNQFSPAQQMQPAANDTFQHNYMPQGFDNFTHRGGQQRFPRRNNYRGRYTTSRNYFQQHRPTVTFPEN